MNLIVDSACMFILYFNLNLLMYCLIMKLFIAVQHTQLSHRVHFIAATLILRREITVRLDDNGRGVGMGLGA